MDLLVYTLVTGFRMFARLKLPYRTLSHPFVTRNLNNLTVRSKEQKNGASWFLYLVSGLVSGGFTFFLLERKSSSKYINCDVPQTNKESNVSSYISRNFVADAADRVSPAVVNIMTSIETFYASGASSGSGFIISKDGFIVTNAHVVAASTDGKVLITMWNGNCIFSLLRLIHLFRLPFCQLFFLRIRKS
jgi:hypothetical protein